MNLLNILYGRPFDWIHVQHVLDQCDHALVQVVGYLENAGLDLSKQRRYVLLIERQRTAQQSVEYDAAAEKFGSLISLMKVFIDLDLVQNSLTSKYRPPDRRTVCHLLKQEGSSVERVGRCFLKAKKVQFRLTKHFLLFEEQNRRKAFRIKNQKNHFSF